jgi:hypothetical protein
MTNVVDGMRIVVPRRVSIMRYDDGIVVIIDRGTPKAFGVFLPPDVAQELGNGLKEESEYYIQKSDGTFEPGTVN